MIISRIAIQSQKTRTTNFLRRAHDDEFTVVGTFPHTCDSDGDGEIEPGLPGREDGILYPAQLLIDAGYRYAYIQSGDISAIVYAINKQAMTWI